MSLLGAIAPMIEMSISCNRMVKWNISYGLWLGGTTNCVQTIIIVWEELLLVKLLLELDPVIVLKIQSNLLISSSLLSSHCIKRPPFSCPVIEHFIWIEPLLRGHLSNKATISLSQWWPLNTGLTVQLNCVLLSMVEVLAYIILTRF
jgi:hypothetical protein